jgi:aminoglycoside/choline kinase family phosphotransferase
LDEAAVSEALAATDVIRDFLRERRRGARVEVIPLSGDASTRRYFRLVGDGSTEVLALHPEPFPEGGLPFVAVRSLLAELGLPVPQLHEEDGARGILVLEDLGDLTLQGELRTAAESRRRDLYAEAVAQLVRLQREAGRRTTHEECFRIAFDVEKLTWELHYFLEHFLEGHRGRDLTSEDRASLSEAFHRLAGEMASWPRVLCHRDFHSRNLMLHRGALHWIDFQDARMGPATYDLASLLRDSYVELPEDLVAERAEQFRREALPEEPRDAFRRRFELTCVQRNLKALGTFGYQASARANPVYLPYLPRTLAHARRNLARHPELAGLRRVLARHIEELA